MPFKDRFLPFQPVDPDFKLLDFLLFRCQRPWTLETTHYATIPTVYRSA
jgi:hypothetical protein